MACDACGSDRILQLNAKCSDRCHATYNGVSKSDYAPDVANVCGGDYVEPNICLECGKVLWATLAMTFGFVLPDILASVTVLVLCVVLLYLLLRKHKSQ